MSKFWTHLLLLTVTEKLTTQFINHHPCVKHIAQNMEQEFQNFVFNNTQIHFTSASIHLNGFLIVYSENSQIFPPIIVATNLEDENQRKDVEIIAMYIYHKQYNTPMMEVLLKYAQFYEGFNNMELRFENQVCYVKEFMNRYGSTPAVSELFVKFRSHMNSIAQVISNVYPYDKQIEIIDPKDKLIWFKNTIFPFLSDQLLKQIFSQSRIGSFVLRVSGSVPNSLAISYKIENGDFKSYVFKDTEIRFVSGCILSLPTLKCVVLPNHKKKRTKKHIFTT